MGLVSSGPDSPSSSAPKQLAPPSLPPAPTLPTASSGRARKRVQPGAAAAAAATSAQFEPLQKQRSRQSHRQEGGEGGGAHWGGAGGPALPLHARLEAGTLLGVQAPTAAPVRDAPFRTSPKGGTRSGPMRLPDSSCILLSPPHKLSPTPRCFIGADLMSGRLASPRGPPPGRAPPAVLPSRAATIRAAASSMSEFGERESWTEEYCPPSPV